MYKRWFAVLLTVILGALPAATLAQPVAPLVEVPVVITWDDFIWRNYYDDLPDWRLHLDLQLRLGDKMAEQSIQTDIGPFLEPGRAGDLIGPFTVIWPADYTDMAQMYGRVRWHIDGDSHDIAGDWTYIQDVTGTVTTLYFPLGIAPAQ